MLHQGPDVNNEHNLASELTILFLDALTKNVQIMQYACSHILQILRLTTKKNFHQKNLHTFMSYHTIPEDNLTSEFFIPVCRKSNIAQRRSFRFICGISKFFIFLSFTLGSVLMKAFVFVGDVARGRTLYKLGFMNRRIRKLTALTSFILSISERCKHLCCLQLMNIIIIHKDFPSLYKYIYLNKRIPTGNRNATHTK